MHKNELGGNLIWNKQVFEKDIFAKAIRNKFTNYLKSC